jgi:hypothetical protein
MDSFQERLRVVLSPAERRVLGKLGTPQKIQDFLDRLPINFEVAGEEGIFSPREVLKKRRAQCMEGALLAAAALAYYGHKPLVMDFQTVPSDEDHVIAVFKQDGLWGAISKTNHAVLRWRDPIYRSPRELAASYFHEYYLWSGKKSLKAYSGPVDLSKLKIEKWMTTKDELGWLATWLDKQPHFPLAPAAAMKWRRKADKVELKALKVFEWKPPPRR